MKNFNNFIHLRLLQQSVPISLPFHNIYLFVRMWFDIYTKSCEYIEINQNFCPKPSWKINKPLASEVSAEKLPLHKARLSYGEVKFFLCYFRNIVPAHLHMNFHMENFKVINIHLVRRKSIVRCQLFVLEITQIFFPVILWPFEYKTIICPSIKMYAKIQKKGLTEPWHIQYSYEFSVLLRFVYNALSLAHIFAFHRPLLHGRMRAYCHG